MRIPPVVESCRLLILSGLFCGACWIGGSAVAQAPPRPEVDRAFTAACAWILSQQSTDGRWCSDTYGVLRSGVGTTAITLEALSELKPQAGSREHAAFLKGITAVTSSVSSTGLIQSPDGRSDSPVYGTALLLSASDRLQPLPANVRRRLVAGLLNAQQIPSNGWPQQAVGRGGWGVEPDPATVDSNPANLSVTVHVLRVLTAKESLSSDARDEVKRFLNHCRNERLEPDGGFWFFPRLNDELNKGGVFLNESGEIQPHSYSTATSDGIQALLSLEFPRDGKDCDAALTTFARQPLIPVPALPTSADEILPPLSGLYFYHAATFSTLWAETRDPRLLSKRNQVIQQLLATQREDGRWENPVAWMREDDPIIATALAVIALKRLSLPE